VRYRKHNTQITNVNQLKIKESVNRIIISHLKALFAHRLAPNDLKWLETMIAKPLKEPRYPEMLQVLKRLDFNNDKYGEDRQAIFSMALKKKIVVHQMRATKKYHFNDFILIIRSHLRLLYEILGYRYGTKLLFCTLIAKRRK
jgi:hypothetical protein